MKKRQRGVCALFLVAVLGVVSAQNTNMLDVLKSPVRGIDSDSMYRYMFSEQGFLTRIDIDKHISGDERIRKIYNIKRGSEKIEVFTDTGELVMTCIKETESSFHIIQKDYDYPILITNENNTIYAGVQESIMERLFRFPKEKGKSIDITFYKENKPHNQSPMEWFSIVNTNRAKVRMIDDNFFYKEIQKNVFEDYWQDGYPSYRYYIKETPDHFVFTVADIFIDYSYGSRGILDPILWGQLLYPQINSTSFEMGFLDNTTPVVQARPDSKSYALRSSLPQNSFVYTATSFLTEGKTSYAPANLAAAEGLPWASANGKGIGDVISIDCKSTVPQNLFLVNGYVSEKRPDLYAKNSRLKSARVTNTKNGKTLIIDAADTADLQVFDISQLEAKSGEQNAFTVEILGVYPGSLYEDLCIQMLRLE